MSERKCPHQLFGRLRPEEYAALEADIKARGVLVPVEVDEEGNILDGHHRAEIAERLGISYETVVRRFNTPQEKIEHILKVNLCRRQLDPMQWGQAFQKLLDAKGVKTGRGARNDRTSATIAEVARELGVAPRTADDRLSLARAWETLPPEDRAKVELGTITLQQARRATKERQRQNQREANRSLIEQAPSVEDALQSAKFSTIVIDPPWRLDEEGDGEHDQPGWSAPPYATMRLEQLTALPVGRYADRDSHLYLWTTNRSLFKGQILLEAWGYRYVTCLTWCKPHFGLGNYFRGQTEHVLFAVKGSQPLKRRDVGTWFAAPRGPNGHSSKPVEFYELIESCSPGPYLELFARQGRDGWTSWGAELNKAEAIQNQNAEFN
jgi:N6-adenosine-specific RNA methylase IME4